MGKLSEIIAEGSKEDKSTSKYRESGSIHSRKKSNETLDKSSCHRRKTSTSVTGGDREETRESEIKRDSQMVEMRKKQNPTIENMRSEQSMSDHKKSDHYDGFEENEAKIPFKSSMRSSRNCPAKAFDSQSLAYSGSRSDAQSSTGSRSRKEQFLVIEMGNAAKQFKGGAVYNNGKEHFNIVPHVNGRSMNKPNQKL